MIDPAALTRALASLFPPSCSTAAVSVSSDVPIMPAESVHVRRAVAKRQREFHAGRHAARVALDAIGYGGATIPAGSSREPLWPHGTTGSIAHSGDMAVAVVARTTENFLLGVDIEADHAVAADLWSVCFTDGERAVLDLRDAGMAGLEASIRFSAKESIFKALFPATRRWLDFREVEVRLDWSRLQFHVALPREWLDVISEDPVGSFRATPPYVLTGIALVHRPRPVAIASADRYEDR